MSLDAIELFLVVNELAPLLHDARLQKLSQLTEHDYGLHFRAPGHSRRVLLSLRPEKTRIQLIEERFPPAKVPSSFTMLCRKHVQGKPLKHLTQAGLDRRLHLRFVDDVELVAELFTRQANLILLHPTGKVLGAHSYDGRVRPGRPYAAPEKGDLPDAFEVDGATVAAGEGPLSRRVFGLPRRLALDLEQAPDLATAWDEFFAGLLRGPYRPGLDAKDRLCHDAGPDDRSFDTFWQALAARWPSETRQPGLEQDRQILDRRLKKLEEKTALKLQRRERDLERSLEASGDKLKGDLLLTYPHKVSRRSKSVELPDWEGNPLKVALDPLLSVAENAERYYKKYKKKLRAQDILVDQVEKARQELEFFQELRMACSQAEDAVELDEIRQQLPNRRARKGPARPTSGPRRFRFDNFELLVGRNPAQNDHLVLRVAARDDLWFHARDIPGSHVILRRGGRQPGPEVLEAAATLAARYCRASTSTKVRVNYTEIRYLKKPPGVPPGRVLYRNEKTMLVEPARQLEELETITR